MRGQNRLIELRMSGSIPDCVWIDTAGPNTVNQADDWHAMNPAQAHLQTEAGDKVSRLDMRCVRGLTCYVEGTDQAKVAAMRDACISVGAKRVIAATMQRYGRGEYIAFKVTSMTDTAGAFCYEQTSQQGHLNG